jgi:hypothetical protein
VEYNGYCLSRGFKEDEENLGHVNGDAISPDSIEEVLRLDSYERFVAEMDGRVHDTMAFGVGGDFETCTAPYGKHPNVSFAGRPYILPPPYSARQAMVLLAQAGIQKAGGL